MNKIITISREFGSGGREIGKRLADELNLSYYDKEIIMQIANETGMSEEHINNISERRIYTYPINFSRSFSVYPTIQNNQTQVLVAQQKIIKQIAEKGNCVIVGRGANAILKDYNTVDIFVYANMKSKINRCKNKRKDEDITDKELEKKIKQIDKNRKDYHKVISNIEWGQKENYDICINTSEIEIKKIVPSLAKYIESYLGGQN